MAGGELAATESHMPDERLTWSEGFGLGPGKRQNNINSIIKMKWKQAVSHRKPQYALMSHRGNDHTYNHHKYNFAQDVTVVLFSRVITGHIKRKKKKKEKCLPIRLSLSTKIQRRGYSESNRPCRNNLFWSRVIRNLSKDISLTMRAQTGGKGKTLVPLLSMCASQADYKEQASQANSLHALQIELPAAIG